MFPFVKDRRRNRLTSRRKSRRTRRRFSFEGLEPRKVLSAASVVNGVLMVTGDDGPNDRIDVDYSVDGSQAVVSVADRDTGVVKLTDQFALDSFNSVEVQGLGGNDDISYGLLKPSRLFGGDGHDVIDGGYESDDIYGGPGNDTLVGSGGHDSLFGGPGDDELSGGLGIDYLYGEANNDKLHGGTGFNHLFGHSGDDTYVFSGNGVGIHDRVYEFAGQGSDTLNFSGMSSNVSVSLGATAMQTATEWYSNPGLRLTLSDAMGVENLVGSSFGDNLAGNGLDNVLEGGAGGDLLNGEAGHDTLDGGAGNDWMTGRAGNDTYRFGYYAGALGDDVVYDSGAEYEYNFGIDTLDFTSFREDVFVDLSSIGETMEVAPGNLTVFMIESGSPIESAIGSAYNDYLVGGGGTNSLRGLGGNDILYGNDGNDFIYGGAGNDYLSGGDDFDNLEGGAGDDTLMGDAGFDYFRFGGEASLGHDVIVAGGSENGLLFGAFSRGAHVDLAKSTRQTVASNLDVTLVDAGAMTRVQGSQFADVLYGNSKANTMNGLGGDDVIWGRGGDDRLFGDAGLDRLFGESGDDTLVGSDDDAADQLTGGSGHDTFWAEWEYYVGKIGLTTLKKFNRDAPLDFDSSQDAVV